MRVGIICTFGVHNASYRAIYPGEALRRRSGNEVRILRADDDRKLSPDLLTDCDVVHVFRCAERHVLRCVDHLRARGIGITYDNDDDIRLAPKDSELYKKIGGAGTARDFKTQIHMMRRAHVVTTTTSRLAERFAVDYDGPIEVIPNYLADHQFVRGPRNSDGVVIGWVAGMEHLTDSHRLGISQVLQRVMDRRPEVRVVTVGVRLNIGGPRYTHHKYIPLHDLGAETRKFDIGIAPIADIGMNHARSDVKVKEYSAAGVPWLASKRGSYQALSPKCGGLLVEDDGWEEALVDMVSSRWKRGQLRRCAERWARSQRIDKNIGRWEAVWKAAAEAAQQSAAA
jgi:hypothetical protein